jgi:hypothetical protein
MKPSAQRAWILPWILWMAASNGSTIPPLSINGWMVPASISRQALVPPLLCSPQIERTLHPDEPIQLSWASRLRFDSPGAVESALDQNRENLVSVLSKAFSGWRGLTIDAKNAASLLEPWHEVIAELLGERVDLAMNLSFLLGDEKNSRELAAFGAAAGMVSGPVCQIIADILRDLTILSDVFKFRELASHYFVVAGKLAIDPAAWPLNGFARRRVVVAPFSEYFAHLQRAA